MLKLVVSAGSFFTCLSLIFTDVCLLGRQDCLPSARSFQKKLVGSLERLFFLRSGGDLDLNEEIFDMSKGLNHHVWEYNCLKSIEALCNFPIFPKAPDKREIISRTEITTRSRRRVDAHRLLGFLVPNLSGEHLFAVTSNGFAEVWLSPDKSWRSANQIAYIRQTDLKSTIKKWDFEAVKSQISAGVYLEARKRYFIEIVYSLGGRKRGENFLQVAWKRPGKSTFEIIESESLSLYTNDSEKDKYKTYDDRLPKAHYCAKYQKSYANKYMRSEPYPSLDNSAISGALPFCDYSPSYILNPAKLDGFEKYHGVKKHVHKTYGYPYPNIDGIIRSHTAHNVFLAEDPLEEEEAWSVVEAYMETVEKSYPGKYELEDIIRVEKKKDPEKGNRYLLELAVKDLTNFDGYILSEYIFKPKDRSESLCYPRGLQWNRTADVYLILTVKNLGRWVHHFIKNVEEIIRETKDEHLHVVIFDFNSPDIDLEHVLRRSNLRNHHYISKPGNYSRTVSLMEAIKSIDDPEAIVVTIDLHLDIGSQMINDIRKHCIKGRTVYAPQIIFLNCGGSSALPRGSWYHYSYGTVAMYKEDWERFGGFSQGFVNKTTWGGEDWDIIDGAVKGGLEIERKRSPWVYHYYHTKYGMW